MKKLIIALSLFALVGCSKEPIEPIKKDCVYDCVQIGFSVFAECFILKCNYNDTTMELCEQMYEDLKCE